MESISICFSFPFSIQNRDINQFMENGGLSSIILMRKQQPKFMRKHMNNTILCWVKQTFSEIINRKPKTKQKFFF